MKTIKELTKTKKRVTKKVLNQELPTPIFFSEVGWSTKKPKVSYLKDMCIVLATIVIIFTIACLATLEAGTLKTCYELWQSVN